MHIQHADGLHTRMPPLRLGAHPPALWNARASAGGNRMGIGIHPDFPEHCMNYMNK